MAPIRPSVKPLRVVAGAALQTAYSKIWWIAADYDAVKSAPAIQGRFTLENERELSIFWGSDTATYDKEIALRITELNDWKSKLKFESFFWCLLLLGGLSLALSAMIWIIRLLGSNIC